MSITAQMVVKNEENFVYFAIKSVLPYVERILITDTGSTDQTLKIIKSIKDKKISLTENEKDSIVRIRQEQLKKTKTPWFLLVDGDEIWPQKQLLKLLQLTEVGAKMPQLHPEDPPAGGGKGSRNQIIAVVNKTRNCVGDIWHYLPQSAGKYQFFGKKGHFNIRLMRTLPYKIAGCYPWEEYQLKGKAINKMEEHLAFSDAWYLHTTHLNRSSSKDKVKGRRKKIIDKGILMTKKDLPEVFFKKYPKIIPNPLVKRSRTHELKASLITPLKKMKKQPIWQTKKYYDKAHKASLDLSHPALQLIKTYSKKTKSVLEIGCGEGTKLYKLAPKNIRRVGIDISKQAIKRAKKNYPEIKFRFANAGKLPFKNKEFDLVFSAFMLEHTRNPEKVISEALRVAKKYLIFVAPNFGAPNRASPCFKGKRIIKLIKGFLRDFYWLISPPTNLSWLKVKPIATGKKYQIDWDTTVEPYLLSLKIWLLKKNLKIIHWSPLWQVKPEKEKIWQKLFKVLGMLNIYPFKYWGPHLVLVGEKKQ